MLAMSVYLVVHGLEVVVSGCLGEGRQSGGCAALYQPMTMFAVIASSYPVNFGGSTDSIDMYTV